MVEEEKPGEPMDFMKMLQQMKDDIENLKLLTQNLARLYDKAD